MKYTNRLKGSVTQALVRSLLTDAGITVVPLGIEEVIREVSDLEQDKYLALGLPDALRKLPDFFAANRERTKSWLIEVKFRKTWSDDVRAELETKLKEQAKTWTPLYLILFFGETPSYFPGQPSSWVRTGKLSVIDDQLHVEIAGTQKPWLEVKWHELERVQDTFPELDDPARWEEAVIHATLSVSKGLVSLS